MYILNNLYQSKQQANNKQTTSKQQAKMSMSSMSTTSTTKRNNGLSKIEIYKKVKMEREIYIKWLDDIKKYGFDNKERVKNPLNDKYSLIYTNKNGLYSTLWNACVFTLQGNYDFKGIPYPVKIVYKHPKKYWNL